MSADVVAMPGPRAVVTGGPGAYRGHLARGERLDPAARSVEIAHPHFAPAFAAAWRIAAGAQLPLSIETDAPPEPVIVILAHIGAVAVAAWPPIESHPDREFPISCLYDAYRYAKAAAETDDRQVWNLRDAARPVIWRSHYPDATPLGSEPWRPEGPAA